MSRGPFFSSDSRAIAAEATSPSLVQRLRLNSPDAWRTLVAIYSPLIYRWCRRMGVERSEAADVSQEVFRSVARQIEQFRRCQPGDSFRGWLYVITQNKSRDHLRRRQGQPLAEGGSDVQDRFNAIADFMSCDDHEPDDCEPPVDDKRLLAVQILKQIRGEFGQAALTAFWRMVVDGHTAGDIANDLKMTPKAVRQAKYRILQRLRAALSDLE